ncbi:MAG: AmmeMemoRadiSam system protein B [Kiritimatiellae bacterium]|nr:AmmeMemoRadiSam system protein B [Kiritimatiellia bacterium]
MHRQHKCPWPAACLPAASALLLLSCGSNVQTGPQTVAPAPEKPMEKTVFRSPLAGTWYTASAQQLDREIQGYLDNAKAEPLKDVMALILPHAGYRFSGQTAAYGAKQVKGKKFDRVIVMGPTHRVPLRNQASLPDVTHYATPLGEVALDTDFIARLKNHNEFTSMPMAHAGEHSVQIEIPFLQKALGEFRLVPIVVGQLDPAATRRMAEILRGYITPGTLVVVSTDFTHYGPNYGYVPFRDDVFQNIESLDMGAFELIQKKDVDGFTAYLDRTGATICGRCPVGVLLAMLPAEAEVHKLRYDTSGQIVGDEKNSVSYLAVAITGAWPRGAAADAPATRVASEPPKATLSEEDRQQLLKLARKALEYYLEEGRAPSPKDIGIEITPGMKQVMGAFVTLTKRGDLRGCIGEIVPRREVYKAVLDHAIDAGVNDGRFSPVTAAELPELDIEISALHPPHPVASYNDIVLGKHGIVLQKRGRSAVFLPQVAPEQGWDLGTTLAHLSMKAGLPPDAWKSDAAFLVFEATVFGEKKH